MLGAGCWIALPQENETGHGNTGRPGVLMALKSGSNVAVLAVVRVLVMGCPLLDTSVLPSIELVAGVCHGAESLSSLTSWRSSSVVQEPRGFDVIACLRWVARRIIQTL